MNIIAIVTISFQKLYKFKEIVPEMKMARTFELFYLIQHIRQQFKSVQNSKQLFKRRKKQFTFLYLSFY